MNFNEQLGILHERCQQYRKLCNASGNTETATSKLVLKLKDKLECILEVSSDDNSIENLAKKLQCLVDFDELTKGKYEKWVNIFESFKDANKHQELIQKVMAITKAEVAQFVNLYNALPSRRERKVFKAVAQNVSNYEKMIAAANQWQKNVDKKAENQEYIDQLTQEFFTLGINMGESDLVLVTDQQIQGIKALTKKYEGFKIKAETLPAHFEEYKKLLFKHYCNPRLDLLRMALERTAKNMEDETVQPKLHSDHDFNAMKLTGPLFEVPSKNKNGELDIADNDALQGRLGDCYLIAALIGLAKKSPEVIRNAITERKKGDVVIYEVKLYFLDSKNRTKLVPQKVVIDNQFMVKADGSSAYAAQGDQGEMWPLVIEKAVAKALGSYETLAGGSTDWVLRMLTGKFPKVENIVNEEDTNSNPPKKKTNIVDVLNNNKGKLITVAIRKPNPVKGLLDVERINDSSTTESFYIAYEGYIIYCNHAYFVDAVDYAKLETAGPKDGVITLQNPHNVEGPKKKFPKVSPKFLEHCASRITIV